MLLLLHNSNAYAVERLAHTRARSWRAACYSAKPPQRLNMAASTEDAQQCHQQRSRPAMEHKQAQPQGCTHNISQSPTLRAWHIQRCIVQSTCLPTSCSPGHQQVCHCFFLSAHSMCQQDQPHHQTNTCTHAFSAQPLFHKHLQQVAQPHCSHSP